MHHFRTKHAFRQPQYKRQVRGFGPEVVLLDLAPFLRVRTRRWSRRHPRRLRALRVFTVSLELCRWRRLLRHRRPRAAAIWRSLSPRISPSRRRTRTMRCRVSTPPEARGDVPRPRLAWGSLCQASVGLVGGWRGSQAALIPHRAAGWPQLEYRDLSRCCFSGPCSANAPLSEGGNPQVSSTASGGWVSRTLSNPERFWKAILRRPSSPGNY